MTMKLVKLLTHPKDFRDTDLVLNSKDYPNLRIGDVVEIYHPEHENRRLLLQVKCFNDDFQQKDAISVAQVIATNFHLRAYKDVYINVVNPRDVALDLVELTFKEQYFGRADMWRLRRYLVNSSVHLMKEVKFTAMRAQVHELWSKGMKVTCGYITEDTRVTYRSSTAQVNIFIQMSCEMWQFDNYGDLYFEKAVSGFLVDLFREWKEKSCNHDVTITLFSRTFYSAKSIEEFPMHMRDCIEQDYLGRFYEDFYRVVVQNEKYEDWTGTIIKLKSLFNEYPDRVLNYHRQRRQLHDDRDVIVDVPAAHNSTAAQGNLLETLNMALNVFETYYLDQNFERTGKLSVVITPGPGVFEVDRELTNITKQRTIDCGNNSDLVCMGEQPLHVVPLFKFHNKNPSISLDVGDDYNIPHWINHSFYTSRSQAECMNQCQFLPRIKMPVEMPSCGTEDAKKEVRQASPVDLPVRRPVDVLLTDDVPFLDYDEYDAHVFKRPTVRASKYRTAMQPKKSCSSSTVINRNQRLSIATVNSCAPCPQLTQHDAATNGSMKSASSSTPANIVTRRHSAIDSYNSDTPTDTPDDGDDVIVKRLIVGSAGSPVGHHSHYSLRNYSPHRALINPFAPRRLHLKVTSNRRRWTHAFPTDLQGMSVQPHHKHYGSFYAETQPHMENSSPPTREVIQAAKLAVELRKNKTHKSSESSDSQDNQNCVRSRSIAYSSTAGGSVDSLKDVHSRELTNVPSSSAMSTVDSLTSLTSLVPAYEKDGACAGSAGKFCPPSVGLYSRSASYHKDLGPLGADQVGHSWLWGVTGEQEWTIEMKTGMDWPSMTLPASLPLTTDYFPDKRSIQLDYVISDYSVVPENVMPDQSPNSLSVADHRLVTTLQVYKEMIATRIARGFQIVLQQPKPGTTIGALSSSPYQTSAASRWRFMSNSETPEDMTLSNGRIFHKLTLNGQTVTVTRYWTRHPYAQKIHHYTYRFQVPDSETYDVSWTQFTNDKLEKYNWNHLDQYVTTRGEEGFGLIESLKYWRSRFFLLPSNKHATKWIAEGKTTRCDIYEEWTAGERNELTDAFLRFIEHLNKIKRTAQGRLIKAESVTRRTSITHTSPSSDAIGSKQAGISKVTEITSDMPPVGSVSLSSPASIEHRRASFAGHQVRVSIDECPSSLAGGGGKSVDRTLPPEKPQREMLSKTASSAQIVAAMMDTTWGLKFLNRTQQCPVMPDYCFLSAEAANWLLDTVDGVTGISEASDILQRLVDERVICHASGNCRHRFIYGFYLYFVSAESEKKGSLYETYNVGFQHEWCEVAIGCRDNTNTPAPVSRVPSSQRLDDESGPRGMASKTEHGHSWGGGEHCQTTGIADGKAASLNMLHLHVCWAPVVSPLYKVVNVNIDPSGKSDREEYGTLRYHGNYNPSSAFELELRWIVGTGTILEEMVMNWARKAGPCFHLIPVPGDPFALPFTPGSDPLRGPIFVPMNIGCLSLAGQELFEEFEADSRQKHLQTFQECILKRYGFMRDRCQPERCRTKTSAPYTDNNYLQYVHCTGGMFVMIPDNRTTSPLPRQRTLNSHTEYITRQRSWTSKSRSNNGASASNAEQKEHRSYYEVGFLWTWNFMMTKRTTNTGDELFQDRILADFRSFCANGDGRLRHLWDDAATRRVTRQLEDEEHVLDS